MNNPIDDYQQTSSKAMKTKNNSKVQLIIHIKFGQAVKYSIFHGLLSEIDHYIINECGVEDETPPPLLIKIFEFES